MDTTQATVIAKALVPKIPSIGKSILWHTLGLSSTASQWDLRTEVVVDLLRAFVRQKPETVSKAQRQSMYAPAIKGKMWISKVTLAIPAEDSVRQALLSAIEDLKEPGKDLGQYRHPELKAVEAEWQAYRAGATKTSPELRISEAEKYREMMREVTSPVTVLYFHGGAHYMMDPATHRSTCTRIAHSTGGRCLSVRYRLAPQDPFPSGLLDALVSYLSLLYPLQGAVHDPVEARHIVFAGDSAGGNLVFALTQLLLEFQRQNTKIVWNGVERSIPLPAGIACNSPWLDITQSLPSAETNAPYDYLPPRSAHPEGMEYPPDSVWPADPPRKTLYADDAFLDHPLCSPVNAGTDRWQHCPPTYICTGWELLADEDKHVAASIVRAGGAVVFEEYQTMPHCFAVIFVDLGMEAAKRCVERWARFIKQVVEEPESIVTKGTTVVPKTMEESPVDVAGISALSDADVKRLMKERLVLLDPKHPDTLSKL